MDIELSRLTPHPANYNRHSPAQITRLAESLRRFGQVKEIVVWAPDPAAPGRHIIAGHGLVEAARKLGWCTLRAADMTGVWSDAEARAYLAADNELARLADPDEAALAALVAALAADADRELAALAAGTEERLRELQALAAPLQMDAAETTDRIELTRSDVPDAIWPTDNEWGIPLLDATLCATAIVAPVIPWGAGAAARKRHNPGTWHFYTDDYRFDALWTDPSPVVNTGCMAVVEPNFSVYTDMPPAVALWHIYRKRWLARWWQSFGIRIFVDLNVAERHADLNLLGVPRGWKAYATRGYTDRLHATIREWERAVAHADTDNILFMVYGGGKAIKQLCQQRGWLWIMEQRDVVRQKEE